MGEEILFGLAMMQIQHTPKEADVLNERFETELEICTLMHECSVSK